MQQQALKCQRKKEYEAHVKQTVGLSLLTLPRGSQKTTSLAMRVTTRTLRHWQKNAKSALPPKRRGRKKKVDKLGHYLKIAREWKRQGYTVGEDAIVNKLKDVRCRLVREVVRGLKKRRRVRAEKHLKTSRITVTVHKHAHFNVIDALKVPDKIGGESIVCRDRANLMTHLHDAKSENVCASDVLDLLESLLKKGRLPLVLGSDNGSPFVAHEVADFLAKHNVIHLKSLPRVPQHNGSAENAVGDVKRLLKNGFDRAQTVLTLNNIRLRKVNDWKTPNELDQECFTAITENERIKFFNAAKSAINSAVVDTMTSKEKRKAEREAIYQTMENFSIITRTRGQIAA